jgi:biotin transport system ATP-binding protein
VSVDAKGRSIPAMELKHIWARLGDREVFQGLSLQSRARHLGLIGRNGAGKSSLLRLLQGLVVPQRGYIQVDRPVALVFQNPDHQILFPTVLEELTFGLTERGVPPDVAKEQAIAIARRHHAQDLVELATHELSAGQKTLVCILAVLLDQPKTLLLDESFANLDLVTARQMTALIQSLEARVIFSTHQLHLLERFDEVIWLDQGAVRLQGKPREVIDAYQGWAHTLAADDTISPVGSGKSSC